MIDLVQCLVFHPLVPLTVSYDWLACHQWAFNACKPLSLSLSLSTKQLASSEALRGNASFADVPAVSDEPMASIEVWISSICNQLAKSHTAHSGKRPRRFALWFCQWCWHCYYCLGLAQENPFTTRLIYLIAERKSGFITALLSWLFQSLKVIQRTISTEHLVAQRGPFRLKGKGSWMTSAVLLATSAAAAMI